MSTAGERDGICTRMKESGMPVEMITTTHLEGLADKHFDGLVVVNLDGLI